MKNADALLWVFFVTEGIKDNTDLMRCQMLCIQLCELGNAATVEQVKDTSGYRSCIYDIPDYLISDDKIKEMINF